MLSPHTTMRNPVMFVVEIGSVITTLMLIDNMIAHVGAVRFDPQLQRCTAIVTSPYGNDCI
jgi:K+-transporting ATPase ATPase B chain